MSEQNQSLEDRYFMFEKRVVTVSDFASSGPILDIGGGGEGIIGALKGEQVIAIDIQKSELQEAPAGPLKIVMDARDMQFLDQTFETATAFFSLMYLKSKAEQQSVLREVFRVLKPGGQFLVWDASLRRPADTEKKIYVILLRVLVNDREIETGYGQPWPSEEYDTAYYVGLAKEAGFRLASKTEHDRLFFLELRKPQ